MDINSEHIDALLTQIEIERRRKLADYENGQAFKYIDPDKNVEKVKIYNNNIIEARRGCGKTSLILKALEDNSGITVKCDCQGIRTKRPEDIILYLLEKMICEIKDQTDQKNRLLKIDYKNNVHGLKGIYKKLFDRNIKKKKKRLDTFIGYYQYLTSLESRVKKISEMPAEQEIIISVTNKDEVNKRKSIKKTNSITTQAELSLENSVNFLKLAGRISSENESLYNYEELESTETSQTKDSKYTKKIIKTDEVNRLSKLIVELLKYNRKLYDQGTTLFLDDFYQINRKNHPYIIQYLHDIFKETSAGTFCFKVVALPSSLKINNENETIFSVKDDFSVIPLDYDLSELDNVQNHLVDTLMALDKSNKINRCHISGLFSNDDTLKYLVIATGGIPRDFMTSFSEAIKISRNEGKNNITKDQIYSVIRMLRDDKEKNYEADSDLPIENIEKAVEILAKEIVNGLKTSVILYPADKAEQHEILLRNLKNLRYLHLIKDKITSEKTKENCKAYLVDMTFYACSRMQGNFEFCRFWERNSSTRILDNLRRSPIWKFNDCVYNDIVQKVK